MRTYYITFRSVTFAQRGEHLLRRAGIDCALQRSQRQMEERGCGYSLTVRPTDAAAAVLLLRQEGVAFRKVYRRREDGTAEEVSL